MGSQLVVTLTINDMFAKAIEKINKSIFPIFFQRKMGTQTKIGVAGTGFFIDDKGHFITASHVVEDTGDNSKLLYLGNVPHRKLTKPEEITEIKRDSVNDLLIGQISHEMLPQLTLASKKPPVGKSLCMCGYPLAQLKLIPPSTLNIDNVRIYYQPTFVLDGFQGEHPYKGIVKKWDGFVTRDTSFPGMSGGPVFDETGTVYGMDVGTLTRTIPQDSNSIIVKNGISIKSSVLSEFIKELQ